MLLFEAERKSKKNGRGKEINFKHLSISKNCHTQRFKLVAYIIDYCRYEVAP